VSATGAPAEPTVCAPPLSEKVPSAAAATMTVASATSGARTLETTEPTSSGVELNVTVSVVPAMKPRTASRRTVLHQ